MKREQIIEILRQKLYIDEEYDTRKDKNQYWIEGIDECADAILALPLDVPSDEEIENKISTIFRREALTTIDYYSTGFNEGTIWMREEIIKRNK